MYYVLTVLLYLKLSSEGSSEHGCWALPILLQYTPVPSDGATRTTRLVQPSKLHPAELWWGMVEAGRIKESRRNS